jgi:EpsI family protein
MKHYLACLGILVATAAAHLGIHSAQAQAARDRTHLAALDIPRRIAGYTAVEDLTIDNNTRRALETSSIMQRRYASDQGQPIILSIVHAGKTRRSLHFPELCLVGSGWEVVHAEAANVGFSMDAKRLVLARGETRQAVLYWFKTGEKLTGNFFLNSYYWAANQLTFGAPTSSMVRLSTPLAPGQDAHAFSLLEDFALTFKPTLLERVP